MLLRHLFNLHRLMDEVAPDGGAGGGGGGEADIVIDMDKASDAIGADLGLGIEGEGTVDLDSSAKTPLAKDAATLAAEKVAADKVVADKALAATKLTAAKQLLADKKVDITGKDDAAILKLAEAQQLPVTTPLPKAWKKEMEKLWAGAAPEVQTYIAQREAQIEEGFKQYGEAATYAKSLRETMQPYEALLTAQGVKDHAYAVKAVMNAHYILSTAQPEDKAKFLAQLARNYQVDVAKAAEFFAAGPQAVSPEIQAMQARLDKVENERKAQNQATYNSLKEQSAAELAAFAADPKHPYFNEVLGEVALLMQDPKLSLEDAYGRAVYANPVTREKELTRLRTEAEEKTRKEAEEKAAAAEKAKGTRVRGKEEERASPDLLGSFDDTMRATMKDINSRT